MHAVERFQPQHFNTYYYILHHHDFLPAYTIICAATVSVMVDHCNLEVVNYLPAYITSWITVLGCH